MLLSDIDIKKAIEAKQIVIKPLPNFNKALSACALDLRLAKQFEIFEYSRLAYFDTKNPSKETYTKKVILSENESFMMQPGEFALASTLEWVELPANIAGRLEGRSSLGRLGIVVHSTAALIHPGMKGNIVLELGNHSRMPVALYPNMRICSISFEKLTTPAQQPYIGKYMGQSGVTESKIIED
jgi:dCTP deaminase